MFGTAVPAGASGVPGDPTIPPNQNTEPQYPNPPSAGVAANQIVTVEVQTSTTDAAGNLTGSTDTTTVLPVTGATGTLGSGVVAPTGPATDAATGGGPGGGPASHWAGCEGIDTSIALQNDYIIYTETLYRYHQYLYWCGDGNGGINKNSVSHGEQFSEVAGSVIQIGPNISDNAYFYNAWSGLGDYPKSGYNVYTQRRMDNCAFQVGCVKSTYPWIRNIAFADGVYWWDAGIG